MKRKFSFIILLLSLVILTCRQLSEKNNNAIASIEWCLVPAGDFTFGPPQDTLNYTSIETIDYDFEIMKYPVTNRQYLAYLNEAYKKGEIRVGEDRILGSAIIATTQDIALLRLSQGKDEHYYNSYYINHPGFYEDGTAKIGPLSLESEDMCAHPNCQMYNYAWISYRDSNFELNAPFNFTIDEYLDHPVVNITPAGAAHFADYYGWRLPTEKEWEKAARGLSGYSYPWGNDNYYKRANHPFSHHHQWKTGSTPVGYYDGKNPGTIDSPSPYGLYDMTGNVKEWISCFHEPFGADSLKNRNILKGSSWYAAGNAYQRSTNFSLSSKGDRADRGFRCVSDRN